jgi:hypothetical protein
VTSTTPYKQVGPAAAPAEKGVGRLPDFLVIGAAKAGTTTLHGYLNRHPQIFMSDPKEPEFFSHDEHYMKGLGWYRALFAGASAQQICGEASTAYSRWPHTADAAGRIASVLPRARLVYILRHPIDRAYSHYAHDMREGVTMSFEESLEKSSLYLDGSRYMDQLDRYLPVFGRERVLCLLTEDLHADPGAVLERMQRFLGVEPRDLTGEGQIRDNVSGADYYIRSKTTARLRRVPGVAALADCLPAGTRRRIFGAVAASPLGRRLRREYHLPPMQSATRAALVEAFREPNARLSEHIGRDLSHWNR